MKVKLVKESLDFDNQKESLIKDWLDKMGVEKYTINVDYTIDVNGDVYLDHKNLIEFPKYIKFGKINGGFACNDNKLTSLSSIPRKVNGNFYCYHNTKHFYEKDIMMLCNVKGYIFV